MKPIIRSVAGGFIISCASTICMLATNTVNSICGALLFPVGLFITFLLGGALITGAAYANSRDLLQDEKYHLGEWLWDMVFIICGNYTGCLLAAFLFQNKWTTLPVIPQFDMLIFAEAICCCCCIAIASCCFFSSQTAAGKVIGVWIPTASFVILGWKHSVVYLFYMNLRMITVGITIWEVLTVLGIILGNILGGITYAYLQKYLH